MNEIVMGFVEIPSYEGLYKVSENGDVMCLFGRNKGKILRQSTNKQGYKTIRLTKPPESRKHWRIHRLVALAFLGKSELHVNHKDENKANNHISNLEYVTVRENCNHAHTKKKAITGAYRQSEGSWFSRIRIDGKYKYLGSFQSPEDAHQAYVNELNKTSEGQRYVHGL